MIGRPRARGAARRLLVECLLGLGARRVAIPALAAAGPDWRHLLAEARRHAIAEGVHLSLQRHGVEPPDPVGAALRDEHALAAARNTALLREAARVQEALDARGVRSVLLKGTALVASLPAVLGARHVGDIDLLVAPDDLESAVETVRAIGSRPLSPTALRHDGAPVAPRSHQHAPPFITPGGALLELHSRAGHRSETSGWTPYLLARAVAAPWRSGSLRVPDLHDQLALLGEHVLVGHQGDRRFLARHLGDLAMLTAAGATFVRDELLPGAGEALHGSRVLLERASEGQPVEDRLLLRPLDPARAALAARIRTLTAARGKAWRVVLPAPTFMASRYGVPARSPLLPLLYLWRPFGAAWRILSGN